MKRAVRTGRLSLGERLLVSGQVVVAVGDYMALPAFLKTAESLEVAHLFIPIYFLPRVLQPLLGTLVDTFSVRTVILVSVLTRALLFLALYLVSTDGVVAWLVLVLLCSLFSCIFEPARLKLMSSIAVDFGRLNEIFYFFDSATGIVVSFGLAVFLEWAFGTSAIFLVNTLTLFLAFVLLRRIAVTSVRETGHAGIALRDLFEGLRHFRRERVVLHWTGLVVLVDFFTGVLYELVVQKSEEIGWPKYGPYVFNLVMCMGNALGAFAIGSAYRRRAGRLLAVLGFGAAWLFIVNGNAVVSCIAWFVFFTAQIVAIGISEVAIREHSPKEIQGRLFALNESCPSLALSLGGVVAERLVATKLAALPCCAGMLYWALRLVVRQATTRNG